MSRMNRLKLWYHTMLMNHYGRLADEVEEDPEDGMTEQGELVYLEYFTKHVHHKAKVRELTARRELKGA